MTKYSMGTSYGKLMGQLNTTCEPTFASRCVCLCRWSRAHVAQDMLIKKSRAIASTPTAGRQSDALAGLLLLHFLFASFWLLLLCCLGKAFATMTPPPARPAALLLLHNQLFINVASVSFVDEAIGIVPFIVVIVSALEFLLVGSFLRFVISHRFACSPSLMTRWAAGPTAVAVAKR